jgi:hypothetical protein
MLAEKEHIQHKEKADLLALCSLRSFADKYAPPLRVLRVFRGPFRFP